MVTEFDGYGIRDRWSNDNYSLFGEHYNIHTRENELRKRNPVPADNYLKSIFSAGGSVFLSRAQDPASFVLPVPEVYSTPRDIMWQCLTGTFVSFKWWYGRPLPAFLLCSAFLQPFFFLIGI